ncbi:MAG: RsmD family RNA methyltransferase [bacterium]|nr:RsmD family RNA methyltransferase [bacterium]
MNTSRLPSKSWMRPTTSKTREALTAALQSYIDDTTIVLDLFAGTGSLGLALLEIGCQSAVFIEGDRRSMPYLREAVKNRGSIIFGLLPKALDKLKGTQFDIAVADPPYNSPHGPETLKLLEPYIKPGGIVVFEYHHKEDYPGDFGAFKVIRSRRFGETQLTFWQKAS